MGTGHEMNRPDCYEAIAKEDERLADEYEKQAAACRASAAAHRAEASARRSANIAENIAHANDLMDALKEPAVELWLKAVRESRA